MKKLMVFLCAMALVIGAGSGVNANPTGGGGGSIPGDLLWGEFNFEEGRYHNQEPIENDSDLSGIIFETTLGDTWQYGDSTTLNYNTYSIDVNNGNPLDGPGTIWNYDGLYQHEGYVFAWLATQGDEGIIDFVDDYGSSFSIGFTTYHNFFLAGYDTSGDIIASESFIDPGPDDWGYDAPGNTTYSFDDVDGDGYYLDEVVLYYMEITAPDGEYFDYVKIYAEGNYFLVDNMYYEYYTATATNPIPEPATLLLLGTGLAGLAGFRKKMKKSTAIG